MTDDSGKPIRPADVWAKLVFGLLFLGFAYYMYSDLTAFEATGGERKEHMVIAALYNVGGKWAVVVPIVFFGLGLIWSFWRKLKQLRAA